VFESRHSEVCEISRRYSPILYRVKIVLEYIRLF